MKIRTLGKFVPDIKLPDNVEIAMEWDHLIIETSKICSYNISEDKEHTTIWYEGGKGFETAIRFEDLKGILKEDMVTIISDKANYEFKEQS